MFPMYLVVKCRCIKEYCFLAINWNEQLNLFNSNFEVQRIFLELERDSNYGKSYVRGNYRFNLVSELQKDSNNRGSSSKELTVLVFVLNVFATKNWLLKSHPYSAV